jgi:hypothetical protein
MKKRPNPRPLLALCQDCGWSARAPMSPGHPFRPPVWRSGSRVPIGRMIANPVSAIQEGPVQNRHHHGEPFVLLMRITCTDAAPEGSGCGGHGPQRDRKGDRT